MSVLRKMGCASALALAAWLRASAGVYDELAAEFGRQANRLPGSDGLAASLQALEARLTAAGLQPQRQTYDTVVPRTATCRLTVAGVPVEAVYPCDNGVAPFITDGAWPGTVVYAGDGRLDGLDGLDLRGAFAVIDIDLPRPTVDHVFELGARAVILVGSDRANQWNLEQVTTEGPALIPRVFVPRAAAERAGLLARTPQPAELEVRVTIETVTGVNLYVVLPGRPNWKANLGCEEVVVLSSVIGTYGLTPDCNPGLRRAANAALLADVVCSLATNTPPNRTLVAIWFGSHYGAQDGARHFYYAVDMADQTAHGKELAERLTGLRDEAVELSDLLTVRDRMDLFATPDALTRAYVRQMKMGLAWLVNDANATLQDIRTGKLVVRKADAPDAAARIAELDAQAASLTSRKTAWNTLRTQILTKRLDTADAANVAVYREAAGSVATWLRRRTDEVARETGHMQTWIALSDVFVGRALVGHFDFDFGNDRDPWTFSMINSCAAQSSGVETGNYLMHLSRLGGIHGRLAITNGAALYSESLTPFYRPFSLALPVLPTAPTAVGTALGVAGFELLTVGDQQAADSLPVRAAIDLSGLALEMRAFGAALAADPALSLRRVLSRKQMERRLTYTHTGRNAFEGNQFISYSRGSTESEGGAEGAVFVVVPSSSTAPLCGDSHLARARTTARGHLFMPMISRDLALGNHNAYAFGYDDEGQMDRYGGGWGVIRNLRLPLFYGYGGMAFSWGYKPDPVGGALYQANTLIARKDAKHRNAVGMTYSRGLLHYYADRPDPIKRIGGNGDMLLGSTPEKPTGKGMLLNERALLNMDGIAQGARDGWLLNESRLRALRARNIVSDGLESLQADAREHLDQADQARRSLRHAAARAHEIIATCLGNRIYGPLRRVANDLVQAVVVLLLLSIPFAFAMERLVFGFTSIYRQVLGFAGFFVGTFLLLFFTHPAFALADAPIVIFLAFVIILLSATVVAIVMSRIRHEIRAVQGLASTVHSSGSDNSTALAAVLIGISGMRNRPLKTFLTAITVMLLTFTILVFASFSSQHGVVETYRGRGFDENRIELHRFSFLDIDKGLASSIKLIYQDRFDVFFRGGVFRVSSAGNPGRADQIVHCPRTGKTVGVGAFWGVERGEVARAARLREVLPSLAEPRVDGRRPLLLPDAIANALRSEVGDELQINGARFVFAARFDASRLQALSTIDEARVLPPDFEQTLRTLSIVGDSSGMQEQLEQADSGSFEWFSGDNVAVAEFSDLDQALPGRTLQNFLVLYPRVPSLIIEESARELAPVFLGAVHVKGNDGARQVFFTKAVKGSGFADVAVPLLLGGLIIFSSLMGSIVDREREIFTYSALGLSPPDVGALFFAESSVYSVIGGMGGYLLGQVVAKLLHALGTRGLVNVPEMNFASLGSVMTILVVMAVVILSTIYPAARAGHSASPGVARRWRMPAARGDQLEFVFPFTVSQTDFAGILSFIREHFQNHADATLGDFAARDVRLFSRTEPSGRLVVGIEAEISLAPFDLGIFQHFRMYSKEFEIPGIDEVVVEITRVGGTPSAWMRGNRRFADELRHQFLLWRSLPVETVEHYRRLTAGELRA